MVHNVYGDKSLLSLKGIREKSKKNHIKFIVIMKETKTKKKMHKLNELFEEKRGQRIRLQQLSIKGEKYI